LFKVLGQSIESLSGLLLGVGGRLQGLGLGLALAGLGGLFEIVGDLWGLLPHLLKSDVCAAGHLTLLSLGEVGLIGLLAQGGLEGFHTLGVFGGLRLQVLRLLCDFGDRLCGLGSVCRSLGILLASLQILSQLPHHVADSRGELIQCLAGGVCLWGERRCGALGEVSRRSGLAWSLRLMVGVLNRLAGLI
jgi:hypothetical protein